MISVLLREFLSTGSFGSVKIGMHREQIKAHFGDPDLSDVTDQNQAGIWVYGGVEFHFLPDEHFLWMIFCDNLENPLGNSQILVDSWFVSSQITLDDVTSILNDAGYGFQEEKSKLDSQIDIRLESDVVLKFYQNELNAPFLLTSFAIVQKPTPARNKQISVSVPLEDYEKLRELSIQQGKRIGAIVSEWVHERLEMLTNNLLDH